ncbi:MAG: peroxiredoxin family protein [Myxococcales bacterium]|nr:peroxiredoxin family protein [Myxococcales bacterium]
MGELAERHADFEQRGAQILGISADVHGVSRDFKEKKQLPFPLLQDEGVRVAALYGVAMKDMPLAIPAVFVIAPDRTIHYKYVGETVPDRPTVDVVLETLDAIAGGG